MLTPNEISQMKFLRDDLVMQARDANDKRNFWFESLLWRSASAIDRLMTEVERQDAAASGKE